MLRVVKRVGRLEIKLAENLETRHGYFTPMILCVCTTGASADGLGNSRSRPFYRADYPARPWAATGNARSRGPRKPRARPRLGNTSLSLSPRVWRNGAPALGETQIQSSEAGTGNVPLVSTATSKPSRCSAEISASSICSIGSPPVSTTKRWSRPGPQSRASSAASCSASAICRRSRRPRRQSRCRKTADRRGAILFATAPQIASGKAAETAARPAWRPSPCRVRKNSLTA